MNRIEQAISRSAEAFRTQVWPHLSDQLGGGELVPVETVTESGFARLLDTLAMTDAWQLVNDQGLRGLATRVQWLEPDAPLWCSWTIRCKTRWGGDTEIHKLMRDGEWQRPHYIVQAYIVDGECAAAGAIRTNDLIRILRSDAYVPEIRTNGADGNLFHVIWWHKAIASGLDVTVYRQPEPDNGQLALL